jgi:UDP-N-acetylglucosamine 2-epimerase (non-hydrolysing)/GDP/UDP-N,N'-diacetylbacillosamine 2-epimerase (hydrolysing)
MANKRKICVVTGTRAEYGLLHAVMRELERDPDLTLQLVVTGMHLSPEFGLTCEIIEADGFAIDEKVEMLLSSDTAVGVAKSMGLGTIGFADAFARLRPDLLVLLGDRFELLAAAQSALVARIPIAHLAGGDVTEGAFDEAIRHSITKMSHLHFVTNEDSARRVRQLGEDPAHVHVTGNPGLDYLRQTRLLDRGTVEQRIGIGLRPRNLLVTFHPVTLDAHPAEQPFRELLSALETLGPEVGLVFTRPNADTAGRALIRMIDAFVAGRDNAVAHGSLGQLLYWSTAAQVDAVVGNSSSGLLEVPSLGTATVNIGDRQKGRLRAASVIDCPPEAGAIVAAVLRAFELDCGGTVNPYGDGHAAPRIVAAIKAVQDPSALIKKRFFDLEPGA